MRLAADPGRAVGHVDRETVARCDGGAIFLQVVRARRVCRTASSDNDRMQRREVSLGVVNEPAAA